MNRDKRNKIIDLVNPLLMPLGYECLEVEWDGKERALRIFIDSPNGVVMDDCLAANRVLVDVDSLDEMVPGSYRLEISSPGIERPLRAVEHFRKVVGEQVNVRLAEKIAERRQGIGRLQQVTDDDQLILQLESGEWKVPIRFIDDANLVYDWNQG